MSTPQLRPLGIGEILDVSMKIAWRNAGTLVRIVLFVVLPAQALTALIEVSAVPDYRPGFRGTFGADQSTVSVNDFWTIAAAGLSAAVISFLAGQLASGACFRAVADAYLGGKPSWRESLRFAFSRFHSILWVVMLGAIFTALATLACVLPGIYFGVSFAVALPVFLLEGKRGRAALGRSRALIKGRWWKTALLLLVASLLASIVGGVVSGLVSAITFVHGGSAPIVVLLVGTIAGTAGALVTTPFKAAYVNVLYYDLRVRKEAFDLQLLAQQIGVEPPAGSVLPPAVLSERERGGDKPPFWPPPPGWTPSAPAPTSPAGPGEPERGADEPPYWPPPPGWAPRDRGPE